MVKKFSKNVKLVLDILEDKGVIGPGDGAKPREVYIKHEGEGGPVVEATGISADTPEAEREE